MSIIENGNNQGINPEPEGKLNRRKFFKVAGTVAGGAAATAVLTGGTIVGLTRLIDPENAPLFSIPSYEDKRNEFYRAADKLSAELTELEGRYVPVHTFRNVPSQDYLDRGLNHHFTYVKDVSFRDLRPEFSAYTQTLRSKDGKVALTTADLVSNEWDSHVPFSNEQFQGLLKDVSEGEWWEVETVNRFLKSDISTVDFHSLVNADKLPEDRFYHAFSHDPETDQWHPSNIYTGVRFGKGEDQKSYVHIEARQEYLGGRVRKLSNSQADSLVIFITNKSGTPQMKKTVNQRHYAIPLPSA